MFLENYGKLSREDLQTSNQDIRELIENKISVLNSI